MTKTDCQTGSLLSSHTSFSLPWESRHSFLVSTETPAAKNTTQSCTALFPLNTVLRGSGLSTQTRTRTSYHSSLTGKLDQLFLLCRKGETTQVLPSGNWQRRGENMAQGQIQRDVKRYSKVASERWWGWRGILRRKWKRLPCVKPRRHTLDEWGIHNSGSSPVFAASSALRATISPLSICAGYREHWRVGGKG